jgi:methionine-rich copper-binding protein CopC
MPSVASTSPLAGFKQKGTKIMSRPLTFLASILAASIGVAGPAFAHAHLQSATPADAAIVHAAPAELDLVFTEELNLKFSGATLTGPDKAAIETGAAALKGSDKTLVIPVSGKLEAGSYTVEWHVLSTDGHKTNGTYSFSVKP